MFTKQAIEKLKQLLPPEGTFRSGRRNGKELEFAIRVAIDALEKQIPRELRIKKGSIDTVYLCPLCDRAYWDKDIHYYYCRSCGQKLDWGDK